MAPMESMTGYVFRNAYQKYFHDVDKYFTPFISSTGLNHRELHDILPEHNRNLRVVPQILTNRAEDFLIIANKLKDFGYDTVNLNLGCPSGTVAAKGRGAGFLGYPVALERFLDQIFEKCPLSISVKTRIGVADTDEWEELQGIFNHFPIEELIIHPRVQRDLYKNPVHPEVFRYALENSRMPVVYNGDIHSAEDYRRFCGQFPQVDRIMLGRGIFKNPGLIGECNGEAPVERKRLKAFHDEVLEGYIVEMHNGDRPTLYKMKEIWAYLSYLFPGKEKPLRKIRKANTLLEYRGAVEELFAGT